ncbi:hypothetical protein DPEC_G00346950 [Dallia pectoralis]|uniref:Uncharacterized protein n=1 Tax=Dallia pectoralis TaxID=75939 RepID=A0ACC2F3Y0_DALPE|nr:hypothetical protein DPEC_G00346950 [Dallia pectoralis]
MKSIPKIPTLIILGYTDTAQSNTNARALRLLQSAAVRPAPDNADWWTGKQTGYCWLRGCDATGPYEAKQLCRVDQEPGSWTWTGRQALWSSVKVWSLGQVPPCSSSQVTVPADRQEVDPVKETELVERVRVEAPPSRQQSECGAVSGGCQFSARERARAACSAASSSIL